jgi:anti-sigma factor RsiW
VTCRELDGFLLDYVSGELAEDVRKEFESHLEICDACEDYLRTYRETIRLGRAAYRDPDAPIGPMPEGLVQAILAARQGIA